MSTIFSSTITIWFRIIFLTLIHFSCVAQDSLFTEYHKRDFNWGPSVSVASFENLPVRVGIGIDGEAMAGANVGFGVLIAGGPDYAEVSGSVLGLLGFAALHDVTGTLAIVAILTPLLFENPRLHFDMHKNQDFSIGISLMKFRYIWEENLYYENSQGLFVSGSVSLKYTNHYNKGWNYSFFVEWSTLYHTGRPNGFQGGIAIRHLNRKH